jgi:hypothetical protein
VLGIAASALGIDRRPLATAAGFGMVGFLHPLANAAVSA